MSIIEQALSHLAIKDNETIEDLEVKLQMASNMLATVLSYLEFSDLDDEDRSSLAFTIKKVMEDITHE